MNGLHRADRPVPALSKSEPGRGTRTEPPMESKQTPAAKVEPTFFCPDYPSCHCPDGTVQPGCRGLKELRDKQEKEELS